MSHTPAPWEVCSGGSNLRTGKYVLTEWFVRRPDDDVAIAADIIDPETGEPSEANARLIAAAPDLLEALVEALAYVEATLSNHDAGCQRHPSTEHARDCILSDLDQIKAAIAKARGESV